MKEVTCGLNMHVEGIKRFFNKNIARNFGHVHIASDRALWMMLFRLEIHPRSEHLSLCV